MRVIKTLRHCKLALILSCVSCLAIAETINPLQTVLDQVRQGTFKEQKMADHRVDSLESSLKALNQDHDKLSGQLDKLKKENSILEDSVLKLQQQLRDRRAQFNSEKTSLDSVFEGVSNHEQVLLNTVAPHSLWRHDSSGLSLTNNNEIGIQRIERLWNALMEQIVLTASEKQSTSKVVKSDGSFADQQVTEQGPFSIGSDLGWLTFLPAQKQLKVLIEQPDLALTDGTVWIDPTLGQLFKHGQRNNSAMAKMKATGIVGIFILLVALVSITIAVNRLAYLKKEKQRIERQQHSPPSDDNCLGRIIHSIEKGGEESIEARLSAAVLIEVPMLQKGTGTLGVLAGIPPLLGLLGTVGGMIKTFTVITEFGSNNTELLSGGIAEALLTTQFGLMTAIPLLLLHCAVKNRSHELTQLLEQEAALRAVLHHDSTQKALKGAGA
ncbi:MotA/TolQ/ExbB proton channel family protein [Endozoicomonas gorgoniicola]|uniref:MotA/TolQ/ExbB proton channel family protein n=1 Tax=Endozoicomonas gorgoniicola TaxID=1234144 RepID=A0ABT3N3R5_9GAMM|nr:MotA/TolQ/ExbB proton channel family protein [Endozoicomonas gorgoniicola]MCW7556280.1 MotA/TolQ/ExbB proton channel family protein [Endozoicomonas gorgoniicola]